MGTLESTTKTKYVKIVKEGPSKKAEMIFAGLTFIVSTLLVVFAIVPTIQMVTDINKEIKQKQQISSALKNKLESLTSLDSQYAQYEDTFDDFTLIYPTSQNFSLLLANMDALVTRNGFSLNSISFSEYRSRDFTSTAKILKPASVRMTVSGDKVNLINLLKSLEEMPMYPVVESVSFSTKSTGGEALSFSISLRVYQIDNINFYD